MSPRPMTHDYTDRRWGHDYTIHTVHGGGTTLRAFGWGSGITEGDFLVLPNKDTTTRYSVEAISYYLDPPDMWSATLKFAPRAGRPPGDPTP